MEMEPVELDPVVIADYSQYAAIDDPDYYQYQVMGNIFVIKDWLSTLPLDNRLTIYGKIPFAVHPYQDFEALEMTSPNQPTIITGFAEGWGKFTFGGKGTAASAECSAEIKVEFRLIGALYPAPACLLDIDIVTTYYKDNVIFHCVYSNGMEMDIPDEAWVDTFTDVKLPIGFQIPNEYLTRFADTENNTTYDLSYYLYDFYGGPNPNVAGYEGIPQQFYNTGCESVNLEFLTPVLPEGIDLGVPDSAWDIMLIPESQRTIP